MRRVTLLLMVSCALACDGERPGAQQPAPRPAPEPVEATADPPVPEADAERDLRGDLRPALWLPELFRGTTQRCYFVPDGETDGPGMCSTMSVWPRATDVEVAVELTGLVDDGARCRLRLADVRIDGARDGRVLAHVLSASDEPCSWHPPAHATGVGRGPAVPTPPPADFGAATSGEGICWVASAPDVVRSRDVLLASVSCAHGRERYAVVVRAPADRWREVARIVPTAKARLELRGAQEADLVEVLGAPWANPGARRVPENTDPYEDLAELLRSLNE